MPRTEKKLLISLHTCAHLSELPSSIHTMPPGAVVAQYALDNKNGNFGIIHGHLRYWMLAGINSAILTHKYANYMLYQSKFMATQNATKKKCQIHADFLRKKLLYHGLRLRFLRIEAERIYLTGRGN